ncbi:hypothetical protein SCHPADRAFT_888198 [Schizopora paradoxa]|uniref:Uncharacterized protein n=1 Tax=Schizopora paradoxa TaxID=27342 RepID=A0A0H2RVR8_9AGAM|nr:hypothetical protein SCHPADRAFT_888198 [Schizopora paradoxa]
MALAISYPRPDSPVPPPMPSPTLKPMPLPSPPAHSRQARPSRERSSFAIRKPFPTDVPDSPVFSLKDALVCKPRGRSMDRRDLDVEELDLEGSSTRPRLRFRASHESEGNLSITSTPPPRLKHRRSDSISFTGVSPTRPRTRSPGPRWSQEDAPPVPPLPFASKKSLPPAPIRIPELGLGIEESLRSPISNSSHTSHSSFTNSTSSSHSVSSHSSHFRTSNDEVMSFLKLDVDRKLRKKHRPTLSGPVPGCLSMRNSHSLPNIKAAGKGRSSVSFAGRFLRIGVH